MRASIAATVVAFVACAATACGSVKNPSTDAGGFTDAAIDAPPTDAPSADAPSADAATDPDAAPARAAEVVNGSARVQSNTYTLDVEVGNTFSHTRATGATHRLDVKAAVTP